MTRPGRKLTNEEAEVWAQVARTVKPLAKRLPPPPEKGDPAKHGGEALAVDPAGSPKKIKGRVPPPRIVKPTVPLHHPAGGPLPRAGEERLHLDGSWERRIAKGGLVPDFSLDLHGSTLDQAWSRLMHGLMQAKAMGARVVLVVTGKPRPVDAMDRGSARGAIRAKVADWLAASEHAKDIAAVRGAHRRHGGAGALYVVLKRRR